MLLVQLLLFSLAFQILVACLCSSLLLIAEVELLRIFYVPLTPEQETCEPTCADCVELMAKLLMPLNSNSSSDGEVVTKKLQSVLDRASFSDVKCVSDLSGKGFHSY